MLSTLTTIYTSAGVRILPKRRARSYAQRVGTYVSKSWIAGSPVWRIYLRVVTSSKKSYKSILARLVRSCKKRTICLAFFRILQESCRKLARIHTQDSCQIFAKCQINDPFLARIQVLRGYSYKILDTLVRFFLLVLKVP